MAVIGGIVHEVPYEMKEIEWSVSNCFTVLAEKRLWLESPCFSIAGDDVTCVLRLFPRWTTRDELIHLYLHRGVARDYPIEYHFGLKKCDSSVQWFVSGILKSRDKSTGPTYLIKRTELIRRKSELAPSDTLTITCTMKFMTESAHSVYLSALKKTQPCKLRELNKLSENFKSLFDDEESCDVTLRVQNKEYKAHKSVLIARSCVFAATFKHDTLERQTGIITIPDCDPDSFKEFLEYLYSGKLEDFSVQSALNLYYTSNKYNVEELNAYCVKYLMQSLTVENLCEIALFADNHDEIQLFNVAQNFFNENSLQIFLTPGWDFLMKNDYRLGNKLLSKMSKMKLKQLNSCNF